MLKDNLATKWETFSHLVASAGIESAQGIALWVLLFYWQVLREVQSLPNGEGREILRELKKAALDLREKAEGLCREIEEIKGGGEK